MEGSSELKLICVKIIHLTRCIPKIKGGKNIKITQGYEKSYKNKIGKDQRKFFFTKLFNKLWACL